jgi:hypothetical protein
MHEEGKNKFRDLKSVRVKRLHPHYNSRRYRLVLKNNPYKKIKLIALIVSLLALVFFISDSSYFQACRLLFSLRNQKVLVGFQNSAELRPTGGFWGSFGILKIGQNISQSTLYFETNPYKKDNPLLLKSSEPMPEPLRQTYANRPQSFVNANWQADFPEAAKSLEWFLAEGWNEQVNGTVAISSLLLIDLLKEIGPIEVDGIQVNSENFTQTMSQKIDTEYWLSSENIKANEPKTILKNMAPEIMKKAKSLGIIKLSKFISEEIKQGRILAYFSNRHQEEVAKRLGISGEMLTSSKDYLQINNANLNGGKSSLNVRQSALYSITPAVAGPVATLIITREMNNNWPNILNRNYTRIFTPLGTKLISANLSGKDITSEIETNQENAHTSFGLWFSTSPGNKEILTITYQLPFNNDLLKKYRLIYQKQPGTLPEDLTVNLKGGDIYSSEINQVLTSI